MADDAPAAAEEAALDRLIGARIRARRTELGLSQEQLARTLGISYQQIQKYEAGSNRIAAARLARLARRLDLPVASLLAAQSEGSIPLPTLAATAHGATQRAAHEAARDLSAVRDSGVRSAVAALLRAVLERQG